MSSNTPSATDAKFAPVVRLVRRTHSTVGVRDPPGAPPADHRYAGEDLAQVTRWNYEEALAEALNNAALKAANASPSPTKASPSRSRPSSAERRKSASPAKASSPSKAEPSPSKAASPSKVVPTSPLKKTASRVSPTRVRDAEIAAPPSSRSPSKTPGSPKRQSPTKTAAPTPTAAELERLRQERDQALELIVKMGKSMSIRSSPAVHKTISESPRAREAPASATKAPRSATQTESQRPPFITGFGIDTASFNASYLLKSTESPAKREASKRG